MVVLLDGGAWPCPLCGCRTTTIDSRPSEGLGFHSVRRRRRCTVDPSHRFTTHEVIEENLVGARDETVMALARELAGRLLSVLTRNEDHEIKRDSHNQRIGIG
jgi:transcriptional regulator NrdR family protein